MIAPRPIWRRRSSEIPEAVARLLDRDRCRARRGSARSIASATGCRRHRARAARPTMPPPTSNISARSCRPSGRLARAVDRLDLRAPLRLAGSVVVSVSQSGKSPDIVASGGGAQGRRASPIAIVNDAASPLAARPMRRCRLHAGVERSVAATKTFLASAVALAALVAEWRGDKAMRRAVHGAARLSHGARCDWMELARPVLVEAAIGLYPRPRPVLADRQRGGAEVQGDGGAACRGLSGAPR